MAQIKPVVTGHETWQRGQITRASCNGGEIIAVDAHSGAVVLKNGKIHFHWVLFASGVGFNGGGEASECAGNKCILATGAGIGVYCRTSTDFVHYETCIFGVDGMPAVSLLRSGVLHPLNSTPFTSHIVT